MAQNPILKLLSAENSLGIAVQPNHIRHLVFIVGRGGMSMQSLISKVKYRWVKVQFGHMRVYVYICDMAPLVPWLCF